MAQYPEIQLYIGGRWKSAPGEPVFNQADESVIGTVPTATKADLDAGLGAAEEGFRKWSKTSPAKRGEVILKAAALLRARADEIAVAMTLEQGKTLAESRGEVGRASEALEWEA